jgi:two-component system LytT family sensor kinase
MILRGRSLWVYFASWLPFAVLYGVAVQLSGAPLLGSALSALTSVGAAAVLGLVAVRLMPIPPNGRRLGAVLIRHAAIGVVYSALWAAVIAAQVYLNAPRATWEAFLDTAIRWQFVTGVILYTLLVAAMLVVETVARLREQERRAARAEALRVTAELQALRAQLNPHFLFNTLHSITAMVRSEPRNAEAALERLAGCLRHVLDVNRDSREELPLGDELAFVRDYLALERMRFGDRLRVVEEVDPETLDAPVLAFMLQPLVENAIRHGLAPLTRPVTVRIAAHHVGEGLALEVADDGAGSDARSNSTGSGVGLRVVRQRLQARYGDAATLQVTTAPGEGCRVHVHLPAATPARPELLRTR